MATASAEAVFSDVLPDGVPLRLNVSYFRSVPPDAFRRHYQTHFRYYPSPDEVCLWTRLMRHPLSMRGIFRAFLDHEYWTVRNPVPETGDPDRDRHGLLAYAYDHLVLSTELDDEVLFLYSVFSTLVRCAPLRQAFFEYSNPILLRCGMAFVHFGVHMVQTNCVSPENARHLVTSFVQQARAMVTVGITVAALGIPYIFSHAHWTEEMVHTSNPLRFARDVDPPPRYYTLMPYLMTSPFYLTPYRVESEQGASALRAALRLPASTRISAPNSGASCPPPEETPLKTNKRNAEMMSAFFPELVLLDAPRAVSYMNLASLLMFYRIWLQCGFREVDKKAVARANRVIQKSLKRAADAQKYRDPGKAKDHAGPQGDAVNLEDMPELNMTEEEMIAYYYASDPGAAAAMQLDGPDGSDEDDEDEEDEEVYDEVRVEDDLDD